MHSMEMRNIIFCFVLRFCFLEIFSEVGVATLSLTRLFRGWESCLCFDVSRGTARTQSPLPKISRPNQPRLAEVADVSNPACNGKPPPERAPFVIKASQAPSKYEDEGAGAETTVRMRRENFSGSIICMACRWKPSLFISLFTLQPPLF